MLHTRYIGARRLPLRALAALAVAAICGAPLTAHAQQARTLSLEEALRLAADQSEAIRMAQAGVLRAQGQQMQARSQYLPQLNASLNYTRTLKSQFEALRGSGTQPTPGP